MSLLSRTGSGRRSCSRWRWWCVHPPYHSGSLLLGFVALILGTSVTASLLLLAPGPVALFASAGTWTVYRTENHALHR